MKHDRQRRLSDERGISMVEIVISMFLLAVLSLAILPLILGNTQYSATNRDKLSAMTVAQNKLTEIQAAFPSDPSNANTSCASLGARAAKVDEGNFTSEISVGACPAQYPGVAIVTVTVTGKDSAGTATLSSEVRVAKA